MRVLVDTNVLVSRLLLPSSSHSAISRVIDGAVKGTFTLLLSEDVLGELHELRARKAYLRERIAEDDIGDFVLILRSVAEIIPRQTDPIPAVLRDPRDDFLLVAALFGNADYLVTGDRDLLDIRHELEPPRIVTPVEFLDLFWTGAS